MKILSFGSGNISSNKTKVKIFFYFEATIKPQSTICCLKMNRRRVFYDEERSRLIQNLISRGIGFRYLVKFTVKFAVTNHSIRRSELISLLRTKYHLYSWGDSGRRISYCSPFKPTQLQSYLLAVVCTLFPNSEKLL